MRLKKFKTMLVKRRMKPRLDDRWVINLSAKELSESQCSVLSKGLNFAPVPKKIPTSHIVALIEDGLKYVPADAASGIRQRVVSLLRKAILPRNNMTREESAAIRQLKQLAIVSADKGRATVVMDRVEYDYESTPCCQIDQHMRFLNGILHLLFNVG